MLALLFCALSAGSASGPSSGGEAPAPSPGAPGFGFAGFEIYELGEGVFGLLAGDFDGDGRSDLAAVNNGRARIEVLRRLDPESPDWVDPERDDEDPNPIEYDARFESLPIGIERPAQRLAAGDLDGDGALDLAWVEQGGHLVVRPRPADPGGASARIELQVDELRRGCDLLQATDTDGDGRAELLAAGAGTLLEFPCGPEGLGKPRVLDHFRKPIDRIFAADLDGSGTLDLLYVHEDEEYPFRFRLRDPEGDLGPRIELNVPPVRSSAVSDLDGDGRVDLCGVMRASGRLATWELDPTGGERRVLVRTSLPAGAGGPRAFAVGDLDGDGRADVVAAEPDAARVSIWLGQAERGAMELHQNPSLVGASDPRLGDLDGDGRAELCVMSGRERMVGVSTWDPAGRLPFPQTRPVDGEPTAMEVADVDGDGLDDVVVAVRTGEGRKREVSLALWFGSAAGLADEPRVEPLPQVKKAPEALVAGDLNRDGRTDLCVFLPGDDAVPTLLVQTENGGFVADARGEEAPGLGTLRGAAPRQLAFADADGDGQIELLAAAGNFARSLLFDADERGALSPRVLEQLNAPASDSKLSGCAVLRGDPGAPPQVAVRDERTQSLLIYGRSPSGQLELSERVEAGRLDFAGLCAADFDGDGRDDLCVLGREQFALLFAHGPEPTLIEGSTHDPRQEHVYLDRIATGDLDGDGAPDLAVSEAQRHSIVLLSARNGRLERALGFKVFEQSKLAPKSNAREPRELICADCTGNGRDDLAVLVHDKLILYVQQ